MKVVSLPSISTPVVLNPSIFQLSPQYLTQRAAHRVRLVPLNWPLGVMAVVTYRGAWRAPVFDARTLVKIVAAYTRREFGSIQSDIADIAQYVPVAGVQTFVVSF
jgi:hypothetical protein